MPAELGGRFNRLRVVGGAIVAQAPGRHFARLAGLHADDDVAVPRPGVLAIEFAGARRSVRMRVIPAEQLDALFARGFLGESRKSPGVSRNDCAANRRGDWRAGRSARTSRGAVAIAAEEGAAAFVRIRLRRRGRGSGRRVPREMCTRARAAQASLQKRSLRYFSPESGKMVTMTARSPAGNRRSNVACSPQRRGGTGARRACLLRARGGVTSR